jgi:2-iminobutanoate/2-iminopropanoate deaminase
MKLSSTAILCTCVYFSVAITAQPFQRYDDSSKSGNENQTNTQARPTVEYMNPKSASNRPFSEAVRVGEWLVLSGKLGTDGSGKLVTGGIKAETKQTMENVRGALEAYGSSLDAVVKCTVMLADMKEWAEMNEVYTTYFKKGRMPARSAFGVSGLALNARVEIECLAVMKKSD